MEFRWLGAGSALFLVLFAGCSSTPEGGERLGASAHAIQGGTLDKTHTYAVGVCNGDPGQCYGICSGALITPNLVVTARHCVDSIKYNTPDETIDCAKGPTFTYRQGPFNVTTSSNMFQGSSGWHSVKSVIVPNDDHVCNNDIALLVLNGLVSGSEAKPAIPGVQYLMDDDRYLPFFTAIGYGNTGPEGSGGAGTRRIRQQIDVLCIPGDPYKDCPAGFQAREFVAGDGTCSGDSGSSAFEQLTFERGNPVSFGVLSRGGISADGTSCEGSIYTRLDAFRDLVVDTATSASNNWSLYPKPDPDWTIYVPPPEKDAGAGDDGSSSTKPGSAGLGESCSADLQCESGVCTQDVCSQACTADDSSSCPDGFSCVDDFCFVTDEGTAEPTSTTTTKKTTSGCSAAPNGTAPWGSLLLAGAVALGLGKRRRRAS